MTKYGKIKYKYSNQKIDEDLKYEIKNTKYAGRNLKIQILQNVIEFKRLSV